MKKAILAIALASAMFSVPVQAESDQAIMFELGIGFGNSGSVTKTKEQLANKFNNKFCYHRPSSRMVYGAIRYRYERAEAHVARWFNDSDQERCERDSWAAGLGYVFDTQDVEADGLDDFYATYTPGIAFTWGENKEYNVQDNANTNWRLHDNFQMYNRVAVGGGNDSTVAEAAVVRYGNPIANYERTGENFVTLSLGFRDYDSEGAKADDTRGLIQPIETNSFDIVIEDHTTSAPTSAPVDNSAPNVREGDEQVILVDE